MPQHLGAVEVPPVRVRLRRVRARLRLSPPRPAAEDGAERGQGEEAPPGRAGAERSHGSAERANGRSPGRLLLLLPPPPANGGRRARAPILRPRHRAGVRACTQSLRGLSSAPRPSSPLLDARTGHGGWPPALWEREGCARPRAARCHGNGGAVKGRCLPPGPPLTSRWWRVRVAETYATIGVSCLGAISCESRSRLGLVRAGVQSSKVSAQKRMGGPERPCSGGRSGYSVRRKVCGVKARRAQRAEELRRLPEGNCCDSLARTAPEAEVSEVTGPPLLTTGMVSRDPLSHLGQRERHSRPPYRAGITPATQCEEQRG